MALYVGQHASLVDTMTSPEIVASGLGRIEFAGGGQGCFVFYRKTISPDAKPELQVCGRLFMPLSAVPENMELSIRALVQCGMLQAATVVSKLLM